MDKLKQNALLSVCAGLGLGVVLLYALMVLPLGAAQGKATREIVAQKSTLQSASQDMPRDVEIARWEEKVAQIKKEYDELRKIYVRHDEELERWFDSVNDGSSPDAMAYPYIQATREIEQRLETLGIKHKPDEEGAVSAFNWAPVAAINWNQVTDRERSLNARRAIQKQFWIAKHIANSCSGVDAAGRPVALVNRVLDLRFRDTIVQQLPQATGGVASAGHRSDIPYEYAWLAGGQSSAEAELPEQVGRTLTFGVAVELPFENVAKFIREILNPSEQPQIYANIIWCCVIQKNQNKMVNQDGTFPYVRTEANWKERLKQEQDQAEATVTPAPVQLWLTCQVLDFNPSNMIAFQPKAE